MSILDLKDLVSQSKRSVLDDSWVVDEICAINNLKIEDLYLKHVGKEKVSNKISSSVAYLIGITDEEPKTYPVGLEVYHGREDFPDIDTDFADDRREEVKSYLEREYKNVASIATFLEFKEKGVVRDVARAFNIPLNDVNKVLKSVDTWEDFTRSAGAQWFRMKYPEIVKYGEQLRGRIRGTGIHAAGVVTAKDEIFKYAPLETRVAPGSKKRIPVVAVDMEEAAEIGLIKLDILGLKTLTVIDQTIKTIKERHGIDIDLKAIPLNDRKVFEMLSEGRTKGVFQCEARPYTNLLIKLRVNNFDELVASNALVRPGAMNTIGKSYIARKHGKEMVEYIHPSMNDYLKDTYGCVLYQEQVMQACVILGGMTMVEADKVRKIIGKKKDAKEFDLFKDKFINNAEKHIGIRATKLWHDFEAHAGYSFNKSHAVAYSTLSYWTAWLKQYYPIEFIFSILKSEKDSDTRTEYLIEAKRMGISLKLPHINESDSDFKIEGNGIRFGLAAIKWLSDGVAKKIISGRPFQSKQEFQDFSHEKASGISSRAVEALDSIGALTFADNPRDEERVRENLYEYLNLPELNTSIPQHYYAYVSLIEEFDEENVFVLLGIAKNIKRGKGWSRVEIMDSTGVVGIFDEEETKIEPGRTYLILAGANRISEAIPVDELKEHKDSPLIKFLNYKQVPFANDEHFVLSFTPRVTKAGKRMANMIVANSSREMIAAMVFPTMFSTGYMKCQPGSVAKINFGKTKEGTTTLMEVL